MQLIEKEYQDYPSVSTIERQFFDAKDAFEVGEFDDAIRLSRSVSEKIVEHCKITRTSNPCNPEITIAVASYQTEADVEPLIHSLKKYDNQPEYELIFVNNGNLKLEKCISENLSNYCIIAPGFNYHCSGARNLAAHFASGTHIVFLDDDGEIEPDTVEQLIGVADKYDAVVVRGRVTPKQSNGFVPAHYDLGNAIIPGVPTTEGVSIWRRSEFIEFGGFDTLLKGHEGFELCARMIKFLGPEAFLYTPKAVLKHDFAASLAESEHKAESVNYNDRYLLHIGIDKREIRSLFDPYGKPSRQRLRFASAPFHRFHVNSEKTQSLSVITTARNGASFVEDYSRSLKLQTHTNYEVVFVDDGSDDGTPELVEKEWNGDDRLRLVRSTKVGRASALNVAVEAASSDICVVADVDDVSMVNRFQWTMDYFATNPQSGCLSFDYFSNDPQRSPARPFIPGNNSLKARSLFGMPASFPAFAFRRSAFELPFDAALEAGIDCDWLHRNLSAGAPDGKRVPLLGVYYRIHDKQISRLRRAEQQDVMLRCVLEAHEKLLGALSSADKAAVEQLTMWERPKGGFDLENIRRYQAKFLDAISDYPYDAVTEIAIHFRVRELEISSDEAADLDGSALAGPVGVKNETDRLRAIAASIVYDHRSRFYRFDRMFRRWLRARFV